MASLFSFSIDFISPSTQDCCLMKPCPATKVYYVQQSLSHINILFGAGIFSPLSFRLQAFSSYATPQMGYFQQNYG